MLNLAMYDAVNSIDAVRHPNAHYEPYQQNLPVPAASASREAAAASAAYHVMAALHGSHQPSMDLIQARYQAQIDAIPDSAEKAAGMAHGIAVAQNLLTLRQNDGYDGDPKLLTAFPTECRGGADCELAQVVEGLEKILRLPYG